MKKGVKIYIGFLGVVMLALGIMVGYSVLSQNLSVMNPSQMTTSAYNIRFANIQVTMGSVEAITSPYALSDNTEMGFEVNLKQPGDFYEFTFDVENQGNADAQLSDIPLLSGINFEQEDYIHYTITHNDAGKSAVGADEVIQASGGMTSYLVRVEYDNTINNELSLAPQVLKLGVSMDYVQP